MKRSRIIKTGDIYYDNVFNELLIIVQSFNCEGNRVLGFNDEKTEYSFYGTSYKTIKKYYTYIGTI